MAYPHSASGTFVIRPLSRLCSQGAFGLGAICTRATHPLWTRSGTCSPVNGALVQARRPVDHLCQLGRSVIRLSRRRALVPHCTCTLGSLPCRLLSVGSLEHAGAVLGPSAGLGPSASPCFVSHEQPSQAQPRPSPHHRKIRPPPSPLARSFGGAASGCPKRSTQQLYRTIWGCAEHTHNYHAKHGEPSTPNMLSRRMTRVHDPCRPVPVADSARSSRQRSASSRFGKLG